MAYVSKRKQLYLSVFIAVAVIGAAIALFVLFIMPKHIYVSFYNDIEDPIEVQEGDVMPELPKPTKYGYEFVGWYYSDSFNDVNKVKEGEDIIETNVMLYPYFVKGVYTISFDKNGGQGNNIPSITKEFEENFYFPTETTAGIYMPDKVLKCWAFNPDGTGQTVKPGSSAKMYGENRTAYAIWDYPTTIIQYITGSGADYIPSKEYYTGSLVPEEGQDCPITKTGYEFGGWYLDEEFQNKIDFSTYILPAGEVRFYAKWNPHQFTATFMVDGSVYQTDTIYYDGVVTKPKDPEKIGKIFVSWCLDESLLSNYNFGTKVTKSVILYAKWGDIPAVEDETPASAFVYLPNADGTITITWMKDDSKNITKLIIPRQIDGKNVVELTNVRGLEQLIEVSLPYTIKSISKETFSGCPKLTKFSMQSPSEYFAVEDDVLYSADFKTLYRYPAAKEGSSYTTKSTTVDVMSYAFNNASNLQTLIIDAENIKESALENCVGVQNLTFGNRVVSVEKNVFNGCNNLTNVVSNSIQIVVENGAIYNFNKTRILKYFDKTPNATYTAPSTLTSADDYAFSGVTNLESASFGLNFNVLGAYVFSECENLRMITFQASTFTSVGANTFVNCSNLETIKLNKNGTNTLYNRLIMDGIEDSIIVDLNS